MRRPLWLAFAASAPHGLAWVPGLGLLAAVTGWLVASTLQQDLAAYYTAGAAARRGLDPYLNHLVRPDGPWDGLAVFEHSRFLYPPLVAELFRPLAALPYATAKALFSGLSLASLVAGYVLVQAPHGRPQGEPESKRSQHRSWLMPLMWTTWPPVFLTIERGQLDLLLLAALAAAWHWRERTWLAGALLAGAMMGKPLLLGVVAVLVGVRRYRWAGATCVALLGVMTLNLAVSGPAATKKYLLEVLPRAAMFGEGGLEAVMLDEADARIPGSAEALARGTARIDGVGTSYRQEIGTFRRNASVPRALAGSGPPAPWLGVSMLLIATALLARAGRRVPDHPAWYWGGALAALLAAPVSWAMSLVWVLPLFSSIEWRHRAPRVLLAAAWVACFCGPMLPVAWMVTGLAALGAAVTVQGNAREEKVV